MNTGSAELHIPLSSILPGHNPRKYFDPKKLEELTASVKEKGIIQPIVVRPVGENYEIIAGGRRFKAALAAGLSEIPAVIRDASDEEAEELALIENAQRDDMSVTEEADSAGRILKRHKGDREETARVLGWPMSKLNKRLALLNLVSEVMDALNERKISVGHAELLAIIAQDKQAEALEKIITHNLTVMFVRDNLVKKSTDLAKAIFDVSGCAACQHNSTIQASLFDTNVGEGKCTNGPCFNEKTAARIEELRTGLTEEYPAVKVVQIGDNDTFVKLTADGNLGVGAEQAEQCKMCSDFGATVSAIPGSEGEVERGVCFNLTCHRKKVLAIKAAAKAPAQKTATKSTAAADKTKPTKESGKKKKSTVEVSQKVKEYRRKCWNAAVRAEILAQPSNASAFLLDLLLSGHQRYIKDSELRASYKEIVGEDFPSLSNGSHASFIVGLEPAQKQKLAISAAAASVENLPENHMKEAITLFNVDFAKHWKLNEATELFQILTKSEIEGVSKEVGLDKAVEKFSAVIGGIKDEAIKALLNAPNFTYEGVVPSILYI